MKDQCDELIKEKKTEIKRDVEESLREWEKGVYFNSGMCSGEMYKIYLDGLPLLVDQER